jgi:hypothetical protein
VVPNRGTAVVTRGVLSRRGTIGNMCICIRPECIIEDREKAAQKPYDEVCRTKGIIAYTNGSGYQGMIGAAAILPGLGFVETACLGRECLPYTPRRWRESK